MFILHFSVSDSFCYASLVKNFLLFLDPLIEGFFSVLCCSFSSSFEVLVSFLNVISLFLYFLIFQLLLFTVILHGLYLILKTWVKVFFRLCGRVFTANTLPPYNSNVKFLIRQVLCSILGLCSQLCATCSLCVPTCFYTVHMLP